jgi:hypothetical protein
MSGEQQLGGEQRTIRSAKDQNLVSGHANFLKRLGWIIGGVRKRRIVFMALPRQLHSRNVSQ